MLFMSSVRIWVMILSWAGILNDYEGKHEILKKYVYLYFIYCLKKLCLLAGWGRGWKKFVFLGCEFRFSRDWYTNSSHWLHSREGRGSPKSNLSQPHDLPHQPQEKATKELCPGPEAGTPWLFRNILIFSKRSGNFLTSKKQVLKPGKMNRGWDKVWAPGFCSEWNSGRQGILWISGVLPL